MSPASNLPAGHGSSRLRRRLSALGLGLLLAGGAVEAFLRVLLPQPKSWLEIFRELPEPLYFGLIPHTECKVDTGDSEWSVRVDADGRRIDTLGPLDAAGPGRIQANAPLVAVIGDSFVFGHGVEFGQSFVGLLDAAGLDGTRFRNEGVPAYGPIQYRTLVEGDLARSPTPRGFVVVSYLGNDFFDCVWDKHPILNHGTLGDTGGVRSVLKRNLHSYRLCSRLWHAVGPRLRTEELLPMYSPDAWTGEPLSRAQEVYEMEFRAMRDACKARSVPLLVVLLPPVEQVKHASEPSGELQYDLPTRIAAGILEKLGLPFVSPGAKLAEVGYEQCFLPVDGHLSLRGGEIVRDTILEGLRRLPGWRH